jgi:hypothetical protein
LSCWMIVKDHLTKKCGNCVEHTDIQS